MFSMERAAQMEPRRNLVRRRKQRQRRMVALVGLLGLVVVVLGTLQLAGTFDAGPRIVIADPGALRLPVYPTPL
jgi:hypothetical protein